MRGFEVIHAGFKCNGKWIGIRMVSELECREVAEGGKKSW